jgi:hypothetical protein
MVIQPTRHPANRIAKPNASKPRALRFGAFVVPGGERGALGSVLNPRMRRATSRDLQQSADAPTAGTKHEKERGTASQRGYGSKHRKTRTQLLPQSVGQQCALCGEIMQADQPLDLDHTVPLAVDAASKGDRIVHASCNRGRRT